MPSNDLHIQNDAALKVDNADEDTRAQRIRIRNRRRRYLKLHPEYFEDANREIAEPLLHDRLVRRFMNREQREQQGRQRGFADVLEANIVRAEAKLQAVQEPDSTDEALVYVKEEDGTYRGLERDKEDRAQSKEEGWQRWVEHLTQKFVDGCDEDLDYSTVDRQEAYDNREELERGELDEYFDDEEAEHVGGGPVTGETGIQDF